VWHLDIVHKVLENKPTTWHINSDDEVIGVNDEIAEQADSFFANQESVIK
jgi:hypothetical protein